MVGVFDVLPAEGFAPEIGLLFANLDAGTLEWREELGEVDADLLVERPFLDGPAIGALLHHMALSEAWWIETIVGGQAATEAFDPATIGGETEQYEGRWCEAPRMPYAEYLATLDQVRERTQDVLRSEAKPDRIVPIPPHLQAVAPDRSGFTVRWIVAHVAQHEAYHGGQAVLIKRMITGGVW